MFRLGDAILLRALPYRAADRLVHVGTHLPIAPATELPFSDVGYRALENRNRSFEATASYRLAGVNLTKGNTPERVLSARVTAISSTCSAWRRARPRLQSGEESEKGPVIIVLSDGLAKKLWR